VPGAPHAEIYTGGLTISDGRSERRVAKCPLPSIDSEAHSQEKLGIMKVCCGYRVMMLLLAPGLKKMEYAV
jgi:hypothetical protein